MRIAVGVLADAVNVRENMLNMLSAGVTGVMPAEYPVPFPLDLALMLELGEADVVEDGRTDIEVRVLDPDGNALNAAHGELAWGRSESWPMYVPAPVSLNHILLTGPGTYVVEVNIDGLDTLRLIARAADVNTAQ